MSNYSPLVSIQVQNFQAIADSGIVKLGRLTVLVGQGDAGKSSFLRAFRAVCLNDAVDDDIRHGEKQCRVSLVFEDGVEIDYWKDKGKGGCYSVGRNEGEYQEFVKTGGKVPEEIAEYLGFGLIAIDSTTELTPQLSDQHDMPFIIWETGSKRARILGRATRLDTVVTAQMNCKKEHDRTHREAESAAAELADVEESLKSIPDYEDLGARADAIAETLQIIDDSLTTLDRARELEDRMVEVRSRATAIDVAPLREKLNIAEEALEVAEQAQILARTLPESKRKVEEVATRIKDNKVALESFEEQFKEACLQAGICEKCGGLLSHEECAS